MNTGTAPRLAFLAALAAFLLAAGLPAAPALAITIQPVTSQSGVEAWLVEDYANPIITVAASFEGGAAQDPQGQSGMASLLASLFDEGAGPYDSKAFQARLDQLGISLNFSDSRDSFSAVLRTLVSDKAEAFEMMRLSLTGLRFDPDAIERMRNALKAQILRQQSRSRTKAGEALRKSLFGDHVYGRSPDGTPEGLDAITREDLVRQFGRQFARDNVTVAIVGAMSPQEASAMLDTVFGGLPQKARLTPVPDIEPAIGATLQVEENAPQASITIALPGIARDSEKFFAAYLMNHILGGGAFSSRLYDEVREKRGLAYSVYSSLANYEHAAIMTVGSATRADRADEALAVMRAEIGRMASEGPSEAELEAAKKYVIGSYAINNLDTSTKVAKALVSIQEEGLGIDYLERRVDLINSVTLDQVRAVARELLSVEPTVIVVGPKNS